MATELAGIRRAVRNPAGCGVVFHVTGVGQGATVANIARIAASRPDALIMAGFCGAADPALRTGDLHIASAFQRAGRPGGIAADADWSTRIAATARQSGVHAVTGPAATVGGIANPQVKAAARRDTGAASVNMEDYWAAGVAAAAGVPFASVRAVLDTAIEELPAYLAGAGDNPARIAWSLAAHPGRAPGPAASWPGNRIWRGAASPGCLLAAISVLAAPEPALTAAAR